MTILPAVSPQSTGSATPVIAAAASEARKATARATSTGSTMRPSGYQRSSVRQHLRILLRALVPDRRAHRARQHDIRADADSGHIPAPASASARSCPPCRRCRRGRQRGEAVDRADIDDDAGAPRVHAGEHGMGAVVGAVEIAVDIVAPAGGIRVSKGRMPEKPALLMRMSICPSAPTLAKAVATASGSAMSATAASAGAFSGEFGREIAYGGAPVDRGDPGALACRNGGRGPGRCRRPRR